ncbi:MAG TPA: response regulator [Chloroflexi bacterium]|jgi:CheY-like chemotaxis protein|nr:response regulator [Chloroflexota bacterium]
MISKTQFSRYVKDALAGFYDPAHLETHPLSRCLIPNPSPQETRGLALREVLAETIEMLRPSNVIAFSHPEWMGYRVMRQRYVECLSPDEVCDELGLGRTTYYRHHRAALAAVTDILWQRYQRLPGSEAAADEPPVDVDPRSHARAEATALARSSHRRRVSPSDALRDVLPLLNLYGQQEGLEITVAAPAGLPATYADPAMLRQIILNLIPEAAAMAKTEALTLLVEPRGGHVEWVLHGLDAEEAAGCDVAETDGLVVSQGLLDVYGGRLWLECKGEEATLRFTLPTARPWTILIVDDKPEAAQLYQRYLQDLDCVLWAASDAQEVAQRLADGLPDLVLLDVLMPNEDGWSVLQRLRTDPTTADVPVVICSMLSQPRLGLALGATAVLQKPISQEDLLQTVAQLLHREDSPATVHPTAPPSP